MSDNTLHLLDNTGHGTMAEFGCMALEFGCIPLWCPRPRPTQAAPSGHHCLNLPLTLCSRLTECICICVHAQIQIHVFVFKAAAWLPLLPHILYSCAHQVDEWMPIDGLSTEWLPTLVVAQALGGCPLGRRQVPCGRNPLEACCATSQSSCPPAH